MSDKVGKSPRFHEVRQNRFDGKPLLHIIECGVMLCTPTVDMAGWEKGIFPTIGGEATLDPYCTICVRQLLLRVGLT